MDGCICTQNPSFVLLTCFILDVWSYKQWQTFTFLTDKINKVFLSCLELF